MDNIPTTIPDLAPRADDVAAPGDMLEVGNPDPVKGSGRIPATPAGLGALPAFPSTGADPWARVADSTGYVWGAEAASLVVVNAVRVDVTVCNIGSGPLDLSDLNEENTLRVSPGEAVTFSTADLGGDSFSFNESARTTLASTANLTGSELFNIATAGDSTATLSASRLSYLAVVTATAGAGGYTRNFILPSGGSAIGKQAICRIDLPASNNPRVVIRNLTAAGTILDEAVSNGTARSVTVRCIWDGAAWSVVSRIPMVETFTFRRDTGGPGGSTGALPGPFTWQAPVRGRAVYYRVLSGGAGGGSGRRGAAGTARFGGGGGGGGAGIEGSAPLTASENWVVSVGAGGAGGAAIVADDTNGNAGSQGGTTTVDIGSRLVIQAGFSTIGSSGGGGGTAAAGAGGGGITITNKYGYAGGSSSVSAAPADIQVTIASSAFIGGSGAPAGGGISAANVHYAGAAYGGPNIVTRYYNAALTGNAAGAAGGGNGSQISVVNAAVFLAAVVGGFGGTGGGGNSAGVGGTGGAGMFPAGGGGGGGAAVNGYASGAGGNGADGIAVFEIYY